MACCLCVPRIQNYGLYSTVRWKRQVIHAFKVYIIISFSRKLNLTNYCSIYEQLRIVFETYPEWDSGKKYQPDNLNVYYETDTRKIVKVNINKSLKDILKNPGWVLTKMYL